MTNVKQCSKCKEQPARSGQRYCSGCHASYMRKWRPEYKDMDETDKLKSSCRAYANQYQKRGKLVKTPCVVCGSEKNIEKHHEDYNKPLEVIWICRKCHKEKHALERLQCD